MNKHLGLTLAFLFVANPIFAQDANPIKWGVSIGSGGTTYEQAVIITDRDDGTQTARMDEIDLTTTILSFDARSGKHQVSFSTNTADDEQASISGSYYDGYTSPSKSSDFDDQSLTYTYSLSDNWRVSLGYNWLSMDKSWNNAYQGSGTIVAGTTDTWTVTDLESTSTERSGATAILSYVQPFGASGKWIAVGRFGFTAQEYEESGTASLSVSGVSAASENCWAGITCNVATPTTLLNGDGYDYVLGAESDATSIVYGFSVIYVFDNPRHTLNFDMSVRENEYDAMSDSYTFTPRNGYFTRGASTTTLDQGRGDDQIDETVTSFSIKWRYGLN